jgi:hypothetical protein
MLPARQPGKLNFNTFSNLIANDNLTATVHVPVR